MRKIVGHLEYGWNEAAPHQEHRRLPLLRPRNSGRQTVTCSSPSLLKFGRVSRSGWAPDRFQGQDAARGVPRDKLEASVSFGKQVLRFDPHEPPYLHAKLLTFTIHYNILDLWN